MTRKIAFISAVPIKLPKEAENEIKMQKDDVFVEYKHPVLYVTRQTKKDKDYIHIYCGGKTYVLMKVREPTLEMLISALRPILQKYLDERLVEEFEAQVQLYCIISSVLNEIFNDTVSQATEGFRAYMPILMNFDPLLRKGLIKPLAKVLAKITLDENIQKYYLQLPENIKDRLSFRSFNRIVKNEIVFESIVNGILNALKAKDLRFNEPR